MSRTFVSRLGQGWGIVWGLIGAGLVLAGCQTQSPSSQFAELPGFTGAPKAGPSGGSAPVAAPGETNSITDVLHARDPLVITFTDLPYLVAPIEDRIKEDGTITLLLNQKFEAAGKTRGDFEREIRRRYVPDYFQNMTVMVKRQEQTQFYFVGGEVKMPGRQVYISQMTVLRAIQSCGDFNDFANRKKVKLTRADGKTYIVNCVKALPNPKLDLEVFPGDTIVVPRRWL